MCLNYFYILSLGSNLFDRKQNCLDGLKLLEAYVTILKQSRMLETTPFVSEVYNTSEHDSYINQIVKVKSALTPDKLYEVIVGIEDALGHDRSRKWAPRHLDIDILFWFSAKEEPLTYDKNNLFIPHREVFNRSVFLELLEELY